MLVGAVVVGCQCCHFVEDIAQVLADFSAHFDLLFKQVQFVHPGVPTNVGILGFERINLSHVRDEDAVNLVAKFIFRFLTDGKRHVLCKGVVNVFFVVVDCDLGRGQVANVPEHIQRVLKRHQVVVHLVDAATVSDDALEKDRNELTLPVNEATSGGSANVLLPVANQTELPVVEVYFLQLGWCENTLRYEVHAVAYDGFSQSVVAAFITFKHSHHQLQHVVLLLLLLDLVHVLQAELNRLGDLLAGVAIDEDDPLVYQVLLRLELNFDRLQHFNRLHNVPEVLFAHGGTVCLVEQQERL